MLQELRDGGLHDGGLHGNLVIGFLRYPAFQAACATLY
jgi:hypothetical protein